MTQGQRPPEPPRPTAMGCFAFAAALVVGVFGLVFVLIFLDSGANTGEVELRHHESYAEGSVEFIGEHNFFLVRLVDGSFLALADLDAANRAASGRVCRVAPIGRDDPDLAEIVERYSGRFDGLAEGTTLVFRENCNGALYNVLGERLDADERNLDRHPVTIKDDGDVVVDVSERECSLGPVDTGDSTIQCP